MIDAIGRPQSLLVLGGSSEIAQSIVAKMVPARCRTVILAGGVGPRLSAAADLARSAGAEVVETVAFDATDTANHVVFADDVFDRFGDIDVVLVAAGVLGDQSVDEHNPMAAAEVIATWLCCHRWPVSGPGRPTSSTGLQKPASTPSPRVWVTRWREAASG